MDEETLEILASLNAAQPSTQQVDYSGFMRDFQPVQNYPNYFVPQQGLLQNTPVLDTLSDLDVMQQRPQVITNMLDQYPTLESDFQRSFAVSPDTFNMNVYQPLPYDPNYWQSFVNQGGGTGGDSGIDLGTAAGIITGGLSLLGGDDDDNGDDGDDGTDGTDGSTTTIDDGDDGTDGTDSGVTTSTGVTLVNTGGTTTTSTNGSGTKTGVDLITNDDTDATTIDSNATTGVNLINTGNDDTSTTNDVGATTGVDLIASGINNTGTTAIDGVTTKTGVTDTDLDSSKDAAIDTLITAADSGIRSGTISGADIDSAVNDIIASTSIANVSSALSSSLTNLGLNNISVADAAKGGTNLLTSTNSGLSVGQYIPSANQVGSGILDLSLTGGGMTGTSPYSIYGTNVDRPAGMIQIEGDVVDNAGNFITDFLGNPINEGLGTAGSALNDATQFTGGELLSLGSGLLNLNAALEEATPTNVFGTAVGLGASGLLGGTATVSTGGAAALGGSGITTTLGTGIQGLATNPLTAPIAMALLFAEGLQADPSNKTGFGGYDLATSTNTGFGMEGDKFKQGNVDKASAISQGMGTVANTIADGFGLNIEGDILVQTGNRDPLSVTYGNQETEQTATNRLNYNPETGDILNSIDGVQRFYYTGQDGFDANMLANDLIQGTTLLSLKAVANDEDTIDISNLSKVAQSPDTYKNSLLAQGYTEQGADTMLNIAQVGGVDTMGLLGDRAVVATNENQYLTQEEIASLLEKGYTEEQIAQYT